MIGDKALSRLLIGLAALGVIVVAGLAVLLLDPFGQPAAVAEVLGPSGDLAAPSATAGAGPLAAGPESMLAALRRGLPDSGAQGTPAAAALLFAPKDVVAASARPRWTATSTPSPTVTPRATPVPTFVSDGDSAPRPIGLAPGERWIDVDLSEQRLVAYEGYTAVYESLVSTGLPDHPTLTGQFRIWLRFEAQTMDGRLLGYDYYLPDVPFVQYFYEDYALHGTYWHNNFGRPMSHGCVNLPNDAAEWLFYWASQGTLVNVHA